MRVSKALLVLAFASVTSSFSQTQKSTAQQHAMDNHGTLAIEADASGTLLIDGQRRTAIAVGKVAVSNLMPGQHIVELDDAKGNLIWKETVTVPKGEQVVRQIRGGRSVAAAVGSPPHPGAEGRDNQLPVATGDYPNSVAAAIVRIVEAANSGSGFSQIKGRLLRGDGSDLNSIWTIGFDVPGFSCFLYPGTKGEANSVNVIKDHVSCSPPTRQVEATPDKYLSIARALDQQLKLTAAVRCQSKPELALVPDGNGLPNSIHSFLFGWATGRAYIHQELDQYFQTGSQGEPKGSFRMSIMVARPDLSFPVDRKPSPFLHECDFDYSDLRANFGDLRGNEFDSPGGPFGTALSSAQVGGVNNSVAGQIDAVLRSGQYTGLPPAQRIGSVGSGQPTLSIENRTSYLLTVLLAGPVEQSVSVASGATQKIVVPAGSYRVLGRVNAANVLPFYGNQDYSSGTEYSESFYIQ